jgi:hypothetical protein
LPQAFSSVKLASPREAIIGIKLLMYQDGMKVKIHAAKAKSKLMMEVTR